MNEQAQPASVSAMHSCIHSHFCHYRQHLLRQAKRRAEGKDVEKGIEEVEFVDVGPRPAQPTTQIQFARYYAHARAVEGLS